MAKNPVKNIPVGRGENSEISSANASLLHWDSSNSGGFPLTARNCRERQRGRDQATGDSLLEG